MRFILLILCFFILCEGRNCQQEWRKKYKERSTIMAILLCPNQKFFLFCPKVSSPLFPLLNVEEVKNTGADLQPYNIENRGGWRELVVFCVFGSKLFFWPHIFVLIVYNLKKGMGYMCNQELFLENAGEHISNNCETLGLFQTSA